MYIVKAAETTFVRKIRTYNVDEIDGRGQFRWLFYKNKVRSFFWETALGKQRTDLAFFQQILAYNLESQLLVNLNSDFSDKRRVPTNFCSAKKVW